MDEAKAEVLAFTAFPKAHWRNVLVDQPARARQQGDQAPQPRGHLPQGSMHDEWIAGDRRYA